MQSNKSSHASYSIRRKGKYVYGQYRGKKKPGRANKGRRNPGRRTVYPPVLPINKIRNQSLRYINNENSGAQVFTLTPRCLILALGLTYRDGTLVAQAIADAVKLQSIQIWYSSTDQMGQSVFSEIKLNWLGRQAPERIMIDRGNINRPAHIFSRPPLDTQSRWWYNSQDSTLDDPICNLTLPPYAILEIALTYTLCEGPFILDVAVSDAALDVLGYPALDSSTTAGAVGTLDLIPDGLYYLTITDPTPKYKEKVSQAVRDERARILKAISAMPSQVLEAIMPHLSIES